MKYTMKKLPHVVYKRMIIVGKQSIQMGCFFLLTEERVSNP